MERAWRRETDGRRKDDIGGEKSLRGWWSGERNAEGNEAVVSEHR